MNSSIDEEVKKLPTEKELAALSEKERKSFFRSLIKKLNGAEKSSENPVEKPAEIPAREAEEKDGVDDTVLSELKADKRFKELDKLLPRIKKLLAAFPELEALEAKEKYQLAYFVIMGADAAENALKKPAARTLVDALLANEEAVRLYENIRMTEIAEKNREYPAHSASKGAASMPAAVKNAPKNLNEARKEAYGYFGINN